MNRTAAALSDAARSLRESAREHKRAAQRHRRAAQADMRRLEKLKQDCRALGIELVTDDNSGGTDHG